MANTELSLPIDIPWKRMGVSQDMIDPAGGDGLQFPDKWRSSIAVFYYEPPDPQPDYCDRRITYLKVACTITNFQAGVDYQGGDPAGDVSVLDKLSGLYGDFYAWDAFHANMNNSLPCYGALLQVAVLPKPAEGVELFNYPYIAAFQPRKREMYEMVTLSGEGASQSTNKVNVGKQGTNTDTTEKYDLQTGLSESGASFLGIGGGGESFTGQWGGINREQQVAQKVSSSDASREKRESYSHSTNINQLYTLLQGYHLGTNRAVLFMQPRPHIQDAKFTFVRGLRRLEGIQEFLFIVDRPATTPGICVEAVLETAHYWTFPTYQPRLIPWSQLFEPGNLDKTAAALGLVFPGSHIGEYEAGLAQAWNGAAPWIRWLAQSSADPAVGMAELQAAIDNGQVTRQQWSQVVQVPRMVPDIGSENVALIFEEYESDNIFYPGLFLVTGRRLHACTTPKHEKGAADCEISSKDHLSVFNEPASIVFEGPLSGVAAHVGKNRSEAIALNLNSLIQSMARAHQSSAGSTKRLPFGELNFFETDMALDHFAQLLRLLAHAGIQDRPLRDVEAFHPYLDRGLGRFTKAETLTALGGVSTEALMRDLKITRLESKKTRRTLLQIALLALDPQSLPVDYKKLNPIVEMQQFRYGGGKQIDALVRSARQRD